MEWWLLRVYRVWGPEIRMIRLNLLFICVCIVIFLNVIFECFISGFYISKGTTHKGSCYMCTDFCINIYMHGFFHHVFLAHLACLWPGELLPSLGIRRPLAVVPRKLSHLNLLLWNGWPKLNLTWQGWSLGGSLSKLCPTAPPSIQDGWCY
jgi:hypothetical protein